MNEQNFFLFSVRLPPGQTITRSILTTTHKTNNYSYLQSLLNPVNCDKCATTFMQNVQEERKQKGPEEKKEKFNLKQLNFASDLQRPGDRSIKIKL